MLANKKYVLLFLLVIFYLQCTHAQDKQFQKEWSIGVGGGPTFSSVDFVPTVKTKSYQGIHGGVAFRYITEKNLGLIAELNYSQQGWEEDFSADAQGVASFPVESEFTHRLNYLEMPVMTHIYWGNKVRFVINLGPKLSYLFSEKETMNSVLEDKLASGDLSAIPVSAQYYRKAERKIDYGLIAGLGLEFRTGAGNFLLEGRYSFGLGDIYKNSRADFFQRSANRVISAKLTYYVKLF